MKGNITKTGPPGSHRLCGSKTLKKRERERDTGDSVRLQHQLIRKASDPSPLSQGERALQTTLFYYN